MGRFAVDSGFSSFAQEEFNQTAEVHYTGLHYGGSRARVLNSGLGATFNRRITEHFSLEAAAEYVDVKEVSDVQEDGPTNYKSTYSTTLL